MIKGLITLLTIQILTTTSYTMDIQDSQLEIQSVKLPEISVKECTIVMPIKVVLY